MNRYLLSLSFTLLTVSTVLGASAYAQPADFVADARLFYRVVACGGDSKIAASLDAATVEAHCKKQHKDLARFRQRYVNRAIPFFAKVRPNNLPHTVVYPFGGGDLVSALITYPDAREITTISLEHAGDPRRLAELDKRRLRSALAAYRRSVSGLLRNHDSASAAMRQLENGPIPGQLSYFIQGLAVLGYQPVSVRFFKLEDDGSLHYYTMAEIEALEDTLARKKGKSWVNTDYSVAFTNMELGFRRRGAPASEPVRIHRHIAFNLSNPSFAGSSLEKHLLAKGKVAAMTKAASFLLWLNYFSKIREYLLQNMVFMASDATGIPPSIARKAGFEQTTYGRFVGPFLEDANPARTDEFVNMWKQQPYRKLRFRYGYFDSQRHPHLMITRPKQQ